MLSGEKILVTGVSGKIGFPIARALAKENEVWGAARLADPAQRDELVAAGIRPVPIDLARDDFSSLPDDFTYVFHGAVDPPGFGEWLPMVEMIAQNSGQLLFHCRKAKGFVYCSTGSVYKYLGDEPLKESGPPGIPVQSAGYAFAQAGGSSVMGNYAFAKIAGEAVCTWVAKHFGVPLTIIRIVSTYGPQGGSLNERIEWVLQGKPIPIYPGVINYANPVYEDDYVELGIRAMEVAQLPPLTVNWAGSETVTVEEYCKYIGELVGVEAKFVETDAAHTPLHPDVTRMNEVLGPTKVHWRDGIRRVIKAAHPELVLTDERDDPP
jgi:nucleoside-diphosphate-sugar epimerase